MNIPIFKKHFQSLLKMNYTNAESWDINRNLVNGNSGAAGCHSMFAFLQQRLCETGSLKN